jgi:hypothetical protein
MFNVCPACGQYSNDKEIDAKGPFAVCKECGYRHAFLRLPLLVVTGASGSGKTAVALRLVSTMNNCVCMESDILWRDEFNKAEDDYKEYRNLWLRVAKNIAQNGRAVVLFGSCTPGQFEQCPESRYFSSINYLAVVCSKSQLEQRLQARPDWRKSGSEAVLEGMTEFNQWLIDHAEKSTPRMELLDTSDLTIDQSAGATRLWIERSLREIPSHC